MGDSEPSGSGSCLLTLVATPPKQQPRDSAGRQLLGLWGNIFAIEHPPEEKGQSWRFLMLLTDDGHVCPMSSRTDAPAQLRDPLMAEC